MFSSKGLFSEILCPHLQECHVPQCMFSHHVPSLTNSSKPNPDEIDLHLEDDHSEPNGQRKRRKLDDGEETSGSKQILKSNTTLSSSKPTSILTKSTSPTLQRKSTDGTSSNLKNPPTKKENLTIPKAAVKKPTEVPIKIETLRPRDLPKGQPAPAQFDMRLRLSRALHEQFVRLNSEVAKDASDAEQELVLSDQALITKVLDMEEAAAGSPLVYSNVLKMKLLVYKRMSVKEWVDERTKDVASAKAIRDAITLKPLKPVEPVSLETGLTPDEELQLLDRLYTPVGELSKHGYINTIPTPTEIESITKTLEHTLGWEACDRCKNRFQIFPGRREKDGVLASGGHCTYHYGREVFLQDKNNMDRKARRIKKFACCREAAGDSHGCTRSDHHVFKINDPKRLASVWNFAQTPENLEKISDRPICIDGEMGYTVYGLELIRLTATSWPSGNEIFDVLVKPVGGILDLNSRWSGVWPKDMAEALPWSAEEAAKPKNAEKKGDDSKPKIRIVSSPLAARDLLFTHLSPQTPLIGHGLENDLAACRIIHPTIIDTALLYPHQQGLPYRNSLKALMSLHLKRNIQVVVDGKMDGHDSKEDANAAGDLVRFALKNEWARMKRDGWTVKDGVFRAPTPLESGLSGGGGNFFNVRETTEEESLDMGVPKGPRKRARDDGVERRAFGAVFAPTGPRKRSREEEDGKYSSPANPRSLIGVELEDGELNYN